MVKRKGGKGMKGVKEVKPRLNGAQLFKREYWYDKTRKGKHNTIQDADKEVREAWNKLSKEEKSKYSQKAKDERDRIGSPSSIKEEELHTRSSLKQFVEMAKFVRNDVRLKEKAKQIGFDKLLEITCTKIPHALCGQLVKAIDLTSCSICVRNYRREIVDKDVQELMGLPNEGSEIIEECDANCKQFMKLKKEFSNKRFSDIKGMIVLREKGEMFEPLLVLYTLGTLLCPPKNGGVSHRLLKIIFCKKTTLGGFNWCKFVINEVMKEVADYKNALKEGVRSKCIGGCIYFVMIMFLQMFPLVGKEVPSPECALQYWNDAKIKEAVHLECESDKGILFSNSNCQHDETCDTDCTLNLPQLTIFKETKTRQMYCRIVEKVAESVATELLKMEEKMEQNIRNESEVKVNIIVDDITRETNVHVRSIPQDRSISRGKKKVNDHNTSVKHVQLHVDSHEGGNCQNKGKGEDDNNHDAHESHSSSVVPFEVYTCEGDDEAGPNVDFENKVPLRRSQRIIRPTIYSPFLSQIGKVGRPNAKERLYHYCTRRTNPIVGEEIYVEISNFFLRKTELDCFNRQGWISECVVTLIANILVEQQRESVAGCISRHIFQPIFMDHMLGDIDNWKVEDHVRFIDPNKLGYNMSECDFVFAPVVHDHHWFCYVFVKKELTIYLLDSLLPDYNTPSGQTQVHAKRDTGHKVSKHFGELLAYLNHDLYGHKPDLAFKFGLVQQQKNGWDCGMYVISWLQRWENLRKPEWNGFTMPNEDMDQERVNIVWWLVTHEKNKYRDVIMHSIEIEAWKATKKRKKN